MAMGRLPNRATSQPARGRETSNPQGRDSNTPPSETLLSPRFCWMLGIREAQEEKQRPARKKKTLTAMRFNRRGGRESSGCMISVQVKSSKITLFQDLHVMSDVTGNDIADGKGVERL